MQVATDQLARPAPETLEHVLFVLWGFPELTQTFIHRELEEMLRLGVRFGVLASHRVEGSLSPALSRVADEAIFLGPRWLWGARAARYARRHPRRFAETLRWITSRPHRTPIHRARGIAMALAAASVAERVVARGTRYIHAHFAGYHTELAMCLARLTGLPWGATFHASGIWRDRNLLPEKVAGARLLMTCTEHNAAHLRGLADGRAEHVHLVYHGLDLARTPTPAPAPGGDTLSWVAVGRLIEKKGFGCLLHAAALLRGRGVPLRLRIVGDGPERTTLERLRARLALEPVVELAGTLSNAQVFELIQGAHGLVAPSLRAASGDIDGIPNVVLEALALGRAVVASDLSGIPEVIRPGETGFLVPPGDPRALADAMERAGQDRVGWAEMGRRGRRLIEERFDVRLNVQHQLALLAQAAGLEGQGTNPEPEARR